MATGSMAHAEKLVITVVNATDSLPVNGVTAVYHFADNSTNRQTLDDINVFTLITPQKEITIDLSHPGFETLSRRFTLNQSVTRDTVALVPKTQTLDEIVITPDLLNVYADRDEIFLTRKNQQFGSSAIDAISSLPQFIPSVNGSEIRSASGNEVKIIIDGRVAPPGELLNLKGTQIRKIIYYRNPPAKYAGRAAGEVIEVFINRPKKISVDGNIRAMSAATFPNARLSAGLNLIDQTNYGGVAYSGNFTNIFDHNQTDAIYDYSDFISHTESADSHHRNTENNASAFYQLNKDNDMFYVSYDFFKDKSLFRTDNILTETTGGIDITGSQNTRSDTDILTHKADIYYSHTFADGSDFYADIVNTWQNNSSRDILVQTPGEGSLFGLFNSDISKKSNNYSLITSLGYSMNLLGGTLTLSEFLNYYRFNQNYDNSADNSFDADNKTKYLNNHINGSYSISRSRFSAAISAGLITTRYILTGNNHTDIAPSARINLSYRCSSRLTVSATASTALTSPEASSLNYNLSFIDPRYVAINNPDLKSNLKYHAGLDATMTLPGNRIFIRPSVFYTHESDPIKTAIWTENGYAVRQRVNVSASNQLDYGTSIQWTATGWLTLGGNIRASHSAYTICSRKVRFNSVSGYASAMMFFRNLSGNIIYYSPSVIMNGVQKIRNQGYFSVQANYNLGNWGLGLEYRRMTGKMSVDATTDGFYFHKTQYDSMYRNSLFATVTYRFSVGRSYPKKEKTINVSERDAGL